MRRCATAARAPWRRFSAPLAFDSAVRPCVAPAAASPSQQRPSEASRRTAGRSARRASSRSGGGASGASKIFDKRLKLRQRQRAAQLSNSADYEYLRDEVGSRLIERLQIVHRSFPRTLDVGAGSGALWRQLQLSLVESDDPSQVPGGIESLEQLDSCREFLFRDSRHAMEASAVAGAPAALHTTRRVGDEETLEMYEDNSFDAVMSNLALHRLEDLPGLLKQVLRILKPDGMFLASMFGKKTLQELRSAFVLADQERLGGVGSHLSPFAREQDVAELLHAAGFSLVAVDNDTIQVPYPDFFTLVEHLRGMGETNASLNRVERVPQDVALATAAVFDELYEKDEHGMTPVTFHVFFLIGWRPDRSQPKPLERGSGTHSMAELGAESSPAADAGAGTATSAKDDAKAADKELLKHVRLVDLAEVVESGTVAEALSTERPAAAQGAGAEPGAGVKDGTGPSGSPGRS